MHLSKAFLFLLPLIGASEALLCSCDRSTHASISCCDAKWNGYECEPTNREAYTTCCLDRFSTTTFCRDGSV
ncbi:uncharacterized protein CTRU02_206932 [Colletotrichum truncatum]|uniref:Uncharacterized protein n=1 Tax=Colletotrichum truncatum TaxID=5467 RepID=A0ACC3YZ19_COLTU|nr:uncharacterized protein CTRU02_11213 [Colletotrichum truncatum]KAF6786342.1 hypothetical protein CTRU02_11213 [Colletotrichum truncatum]